MPRLERLLYGPETKVKTGNINLTYMGLVDKIRRAYLVKDLDALQPAVRRAVERISTSDACPSCGGTRLNALARSSLIDGRNIADLAAMQISDLADFLRGIEDAGLRPILESLLDLLDSMVHIGLGYLSLDRESSTLSGGEAQRTKMVRHLGSSLTDVSYVFDEPTIGLHAHDVEQMNGLLQRLRDKGNTVLVVEHDPEVMRIADHVVDMGPGAGVSRRRGRLRGLVRRALGVGHADRPAPRGAAGAEGGRSGRPAAPSRSATRGSTTSRTSRSTSRSACSWR